MHGLATATCSEHVFAARGPTARRPRATRPSVGLLLIFVLGVSGCAGVFGPGGGEAETFHLSDQASSGDPAFRASMRLVLDGLDADADAAPDLALVRYERSLQVDPTNAYAYLALARHRVDGEDPDSALPFVDKAKALLEVRGELSPGVEAHLDGLRGSALLASGRRAEAMPFLDRARALAPVTWSDGRLDPEELR